MRTCLHLRIALVLLAFRLHSPAQEVLAVKIVGNIVLVPMTLNGTVFSFLLDTGSEQSSIAPVLTYPLRISLSAPLFLFRQRLINWLTGRFPLFQRTTEQSDRRSDLKKVTDSDAFQPEDKQAVKADLEAMKEKAKESRSGPIDSGRGQ